jgi:hypothetical protein
MRFAYSGSDFRLRLRWQAILVEGVRLMIRDGVHRYHRMIGELHLKGKTT